MIFGETQGLDHGNGCNGILQVMRSLQRWPIRLTGNFSRTCIDDILHPTEIAQAAQRQSRFFIGAGENRCMIGSQHIKQARFGRSISVKSVVAIKMVRTYVEEHRDITVETAGLINLIAGQFQHIDPAFRQRLL